MTLEAMVQDERLSKPERRISSEQNFARASGIQFQNREGKQELAGRQAGE